MRYITSFLAALLISCSSCSLASTTLKVNHLVVLGDSYSDNGNTYAASNNTYPGHPYALGRFSNGPTWSTYLASMLGIDPMDPTAFQNFAYGQAQIIGSTEFDTYNQDTSGKTWKFTVPDLNNEINQYETESETYPAQSLFIVFIGTNDLLNYPLTPNTQSTNQFVSKLINALKQNVKRLETQGAKHIILVNMRALEYSPLAHQLADASVKAGVFTSQKAYMSALVSAIVSFNEQLKQSFQADPSVSIFSANQFDKQWLNGKKSESYPYYRAQYHLSEINTPCYVNHGNYVQQSSSVCADPMNHFFFDRIHPTTTIHYQMAKALDQFIQRNDLVASGG